MQIVTSAELLEQTVLSPAEFFREHGWYVSREVLSSDLLEQARLGLEEHWAGHRDCQLPGAGEKFADWMPGDGAGTRNNEYISLQNARVGRLVRCADIGRITCEVTGLARVRLFDDQMVFKPGRQPASAVGWHVDGDYWQTCSSPHMVTAWIPLHDCPEAMGPLVVLDGSHHWSHTIDRSALSFHQADMGSLERHLTSAGHECRPVVMVLKRGQFSLHHCRAIHGSFPNRASAPRIALALHMQDGDNQYRPAFRPDGTLIRLYNDSICRKSPADLPDYSDDAVFPELWNTLTGTLVDGQS
jgi:hypothetical protein